MIPFARDQGRIAEARHLRSNGWSISDIRTAVGGGSKFVRAAVADIEVPRGTMRAPHPEYIRQAAVAAYGKRSMSLVAADLGVSTGAVSHWWAAAKRDGINKPLFGRHDGGKFHSGRQSRGRGIATYQGERVEMVPHRYSTVASGNASPAAMAAGV